MRPDNKAVMRSSGGKTGLVSTYDPFDRAKRESSCFSSDNPESAEAIPRKTGGTGPPFIFQFRTIRGCERGGSAK